MAAGASAVSTPPAPVRGPAICLQPGRLPVHPTGRGGNHLSRSRTARGLRHARREAALGDVRAYVHALETWVIEALGELGVRGSARSTDVSAYGCARQGSGEARPRQDRCDRVRLRRWVSSHGFSLNVDPDLAALRGHRAVR